MHTALYDSLAALEAGVQEMGTMPPEWHEKMVHRLPTAPAVDRVAWLVQRCTGKTVVHFGAGGALHGILKKVCTHLYGVDKDEIPGCVQCDLDWGLEQLPVFDGVELVLLPEILEHLCNPGWLLTLLRDQYPGRAMIITTPSMLCPQPRLKDGVILVNRDHTQWYCPQTIKVLLNKCDVSIQEFFYYNGTPPYCEGMIVVTHV